VTVKLTTPCFAGLSEYKASAASADAALTTPGPCPVHLECPGKSMRGSWVDPREKHIFNHDIFGRLALDLNLDKKCAILISPHCLLCSSSN